MSVCQHCGSDAVTRHGTDLYGQYIKQRFRCGICGKSRFLDLIKVDQGFDSRFPDGRPSFSLRHIRTSRKAGYFRFSIPEHLDPHCVFEPGCAVVFERFDEGFTIRPYVNGDVGQEGIHVRNFDDKTLLLIHITSVPDLARIDFDYIRRCVSL